MSLLAASLLPAPAGAASEPENPKPRLAVEFTIMPWLRLWAVDPDASPPGANDWNCKPTDRHPEPVVLVHGIVATRSYWATLAPLLANEGYCVFAVTYGVKAGLPGFGGVEAMERSSPQLGEFCGACRQLVAGSEFLAHLDEGGARAVAGVDYTLVVSRHDELVTPYTSGTLEGPNARNIVRIRSDHAHVVLTRCRRLGQSPLAPLPLEFRWRGGQVSRTRAGRRLRLRLDDRREGGDRQLLGCARLGRMRRRRAHRSPGHVHGHGSRRGRVHIFGRISPLLVDRSLRHALTTGHCPVVT